MFKSIFASVTFVFLIFATLASGVFYAMLKVEPHLYSRVLSERFRIASYHSQLYLNELITYDELVRNLDKQGVSVLPQNSTLNLEQFEIISNIALYTDESGVYKNGSNYIIQLIENNRQLYLLDVEENSKVIEFIRLGFGAAMGLMLFFYFYIILKLRPLSKLKKEVQKFGEGNFEIKNLAKGEDEISVIAGAFYNAAKELSNLQETRRLFLRNCLHEIKTPITKGRLVCEMVENEKLKGRLESIFQRMENLVQEFVVVEKTKTMFKKENASEFKVMNVVENAIDLALIDRQLVSITPNFDAKIWCDFELLSIAFKNLIDNAIKYSPQGKMKIVINQHDVAFINKGEPLANDLQTYQQPFLKGENSKNGFGLGLYIITNIIAAHGFSLNYTHKNHTNVFVIDFGEVNLAHAHKQVRGGADAALTKS